MKYLSYPSKSVILINRILYSFIIGVIFSLGLVLSIEKGSIKILLIFAFFSLFLFLCFRLDILFKISNNIIVDDDFEFIYIGKKKISINHISRIDNSFTIKALYCIVFKDLKVKKIYFVNTKRYFPILFYFESNYIKILREKIK